MNEGAEEPSDSAGGNHGYIDESDNFDDGFAGSAWGRLASWAITQPATDPIDITDSGGIAGSLQAGL